MASRNKYNTLANIAEGALSGFDYGTRFARQRKQDELQAQKAEYQMRRQDALDQRQQVQDQRAAQEFDWKKTKFEWEKNKELSTQAKQRMIGLVKAAGPFSARSTPELVKRDVSSYLKQTRGINVPPERITNVGISEDDTFRATFLDDKGQESILFDMPMTQLASTLGIKAPIGKNALTPVKGMAGLAQNKDGDYFTFDKKNQTIVPVATSGKEKKVIDTIGELKATVIDKATEGERDFWKGSTWFSARSGKIKDKIEDVRNLGRKNLVMKNSDGEAIEIPLDDKDKALKLIDASLKNGYDITVDEKAKRSRSIGLMSSSEGTLGGGRSNNMPDIITVEDPKTGQQIKIKKEGLDIARQKGLRIIK